MAVHAYVRHTHVSDLSGCNAVYCYGNGDANAWALSCRIENTPWIAVLDRSAVDNVAVPYAQPFEGECVSFGSDFVVNFDYESLAFDATPNVGDLIVSNESLLVRCHQRRGPFYLDLMSGDAVAPPNFFATFRRWSIAVPRHSADRDAFTTIFEHPAVLHKE